MAYSFDHVAQVVPDVAAAVAFYTDLIPGAKVLYQDATWGFVEAGGAKLAFVVADQHPTHLAWRMGAAELAALAAAHGKPLQRHRDGTRSFYVEGPGGMAIELITYDPE